MNQFSFAIIGGGPAAFYTSKLLLRLPSQPLVHIYEKQLCPFGLIRYGVAPDHVSIKKSQTRLSQQVTHPNFKYFGNCEVSTKGLKQLRNTYSGIIYAYGASLNHPPQWLPKPPFELPSTVKFARDLVYWYNGHPSHESIRQNLQKIKNLTIIGNGNVAIDVARILLRRPGQLQKTEISKPALQELKKCDIRNIQIVGRRGVTHSAFAVKQIREVHELGIKMYAVQEQLEDSMTPSSQIQCTAIGDHFNSVVRMNKRKVQFIREKFTIIKQSEVQKQKLKPFKKIFFRYLLNPVSLTQNSIVCQNVHLEGQPFKQTTFPTSKLTTLPFDMLVLSTGFEVSPIEPSHYNKEKKKVNNSDGCVISNTSDKVEIGSYAVGWCKNGPKGVLDETLLSCQQTLNNLRIHMDNGVLEEKRRVEGPQKFISFEEYHKIREIQLEKGDREKFIKKKLTSKELKQFYGVNQTFKI